MGSKNVFFMFIVLVFLLLFSGQAIASDMESKNKWILVETKEITLEMEDSAEKEHMFIYDNKKFIPLRKAMDIAHLSVEWDDVERSIHINGKNNSHSFTLQTESLNDGSISFDEKISANGAIVIEDHSSQVMFEKNSNLKFYPASTVKIMTALLALERGELDDLVTVSSKVNELPNDSRRAHIKPGHQLTLEQLLYGMLLYSGNDSAVAIAEHIGGSEENFIKMMNEKAIELGAENTQFVNPHGYHDPNQYTTPYDLALITKAATKSEAFLEIINKPYYKAVFKDKDGEIIVRHWDTTNQFLKNKEVNIHGVIGGKTGYTDASKHNLVTITEHAGHQYISVILKGDYWGRYNDTKKMLENAYQLRRIHDQQMKREIFITEGINEIVYNGMPLEHSGESFIFEGSTYISEKLLNHLLSNNKGFKANKEINKRKKLSYHKSLNSVLFRTTFRPYRFLATLQIDHTLTRDKRVIPKYEEVWRDFMAYQQVKEVTITVHSPYLAYQPFRL